VRGLIGVGFHFHGPDQNFAKISWAKPNLCRSSQNLGGSPNNFGAVSGALHLHGAYICLASYYTML
jgi:hypothetical protein